MAIVRKKIAQKRGFSLMELLVVMAIMLVMLVVVLTKGSSNKKAFDVESTARQVTAQIRALQNEALNGKRFGADVACRYIFNASDAIYTISYSRDCASNDLIAIGTQNVDLTKKKTFFPAPVGFYFNAPFGKPSAPQSIKISSAMAGSTEAMYICISSEGSITEQKTACP